MSSEKTLFFGKYIIRTCIFLFAPLALLMLMPPFFISSTTAEQTDSDLLPSNSASLSASLRYEVENYLITDEKNLTVTTNNAAGYKVITETTDNQEIWSIIPEYSPSKTTIKDISYLQEMTSEICDATPTPSAFEDSAGIFINTSVPEATLIDQRDNQPYTVRKLADGKCWMTDNLRLNLEAGKTLTPETTDISSDFYITEDTQVNAGTRWGSGEPTESEVNTIHSYNSHNIDYGNYYNWFAATASTGTYYMAEKTTDQSICPKGWQLPKSEGVSSLSNLVDVYKLHENGTDVSVESLLSDKPLSFALAGDYYYNGVVGGQGEWADYWTADVANLVAASFDLETGRMNYNHKTAGLSVRCVAR